MRERCGGCYETSFIAEVLHVAVEWLYLPTDCMMSRSIGAAKSGLRWMNMDRATTARHRVSSSYSSRTAAQSRHLQVATGATGHLSCVQTAGA